ncbi:MAG: hypothetical protein Q3978_02415 [Limosilactobacillus gorillae]|nr:hypothetical protein [Limosilactobacillus gorillae]
MKVRLNYVIRSININLGFIRAFGRWKLFPIQTLLENQKFVHELETKRLEQEKESNDKNCEFQAEITKLNNELKINLEKDSQTFQINQTKLDKSLIIKQNLIPEVKSVFISYLAITVGEISDSKTFPILFSQNQHQLEAQVVLYCPKVVKLINEFKTNNDSSVVKTDPDLSPENKLIELLEEKIIPVLSEQLLLIDSTADDR